MGEGNKDCRVRIEEGKGSGKVFPFSLLQSLLGNPYFFPVLFCCLPLLSAGCHKPPPVRPLSVIVSCDTAGWIVPCGCSSKQAGGLLRRATYVQGIRGGADVLLADAGGAPGGTSPYDRAKFAAVLRGEVEMQTAAHNLGAAEAELGAKSLRSLAETTKAPFVSSNVRDEQGQEIAATHRLVTVETRRVAVLGVLSPKFARGGLRVDDPAEAVLRLIPTLKGQFDLLLVLAYLPEDELEVFVARVPEADLVVGGPTRQSIAPRRTGPTTWAATTNKGKFLVHLEQSARGAAWDGKIVELNDTFADDAKQVANLKRFRDELARTDFSADQTSFSPSLPTDLPKDVFRVAGTDACRKCHANDCQSWTGSRHGHAWKTLVEKSSHVDPYCQHCHATGYGLPGGFASLAKSFPSRVDVGCESCHGPSVAHVLKPATKTIYDARERCVQCHDHENSPQFAYEKFWEQIAHGEAANTVEEK
ncbi:MAG: hypothetical protein IAG10_17145 [Planctomycetaceae bacterium]|nr:hypothetical protein [Planctomycetaceae bacterium]